MKGSFAKIWASFDRSLGSFYTPHTKTIILVGGQAADSMACRALLLGYGLLLKDHWAVFIYHIQQTIYIYLGSQAVDLMALLEHSNTPEGEGGGEGGGRWKFAAGIGGAMLILGICDLIRVCVVLLVLVRCSIVLNAVLRTPPPPCLKHAPLQGGGG